MKKYLLLVIAILSICLVTVTGSLAFITATTDTVTNTFTFGDINITLEETTSEYKMIPGNTIAKDPTITVVANSVDCYLFVEVEESENFDEFMSYAIAQGWTELETGVYYRLVSASSSNQSFSVLANNNVFVLETVTKTMMNELTDETLPTLTFTAYAIQQANIADAAAAWNNLH